MNKLPAADKRSPAQWWIDAIADTVSDYAAYAHGINDARFADIAYEIKSENYIVIDNSHGNRRIVVSVMEA